MPGRAAPDVAWLDLEVARRRAVAARPALAHDSALHRQPVTTLDDLLGARAARRGAARPRRGLRSRADDDDDAVLATPATSPSGRRSSGRRRCATSTPSRATSGRCGSAAAARSRRPGTGCRSSTSATSRRSAGRTSPVWSPAASHELDYELEVAALDRHAGASTWRPNGAEEAIGGYTIFNDWSARDLQREETAVRLGPAKGKDFASSFGPWLVTPDELADARRGTGYDLAMTAEVNGTETSRGRWSDAQFSFGDMLARASADARLRPGDLIGSGTVGTGCLLEVRDATLGRYLEPGDEVVARASSGSARFGPRSCARPART